MNTLEDGEEVDRHDDECGCQKVEVKTCKKCGKETYNHHKSVPIVMCVGCEYESNPRFAEVNKELLNKLHNV